MATRNILFVMCDRLRAERDDAHPVYRAFRRERVSEVLGKASKEGGKD